MRLECQYCDEPVFDNWITYCIHVYENHKQQHWDDEIQCKVCSQTTGLDGIKSHFHWSHKEQYEKSKELILDRADFVCWICEQTIPNKRGHSRHLKEQHNYVYELWCYFEECSKNYFCDKCVKGYKQKNWYQKHMREEHPDDWNETKKLEALEHDYVCEECEPWEGFDDERSLNVHMGRVHKGSFKQKQRERALEEPYRCVFCDPIQGFSSVEGFCSHLYKMHKYAMGYLWLLCQLNLPYKCDECEFIRGFESKKGLHQHKGMVHGGSRVTKQCPYCGEEYDVKPACVDNRVTCGKDSCSAKAQSEAIMIGDEPIEPLYRGGSWKQRRKEIIERDNEQCQECGMTRDEHYEKYGRDLDVDHLIPIRYFKDKFDGEYWHEANLKLNLKTFCRSCHRRIESNKQY